MKIFLRKNKPLLLQSVSTLVRPTLVFYCFLRKEELHDRVRRYLGHQMPVYRTEIPLKAVILVYPCEICGN